MKRWQTVLAAWSVGGAVFTVRLQTVGTCLHSSQNTGDRTKWRGRERGGRGEREREGETGSMERQGVGRERGGGR